MIVLPKRTPEAVVNALKRHREDPTTSGVVPSTINKSPAQEQSVEKIVETNDLLYPGKNFTGNFLI